MYKTIISILFMAGLIQAADYSDRAWYWCQHNGHTEATAGLKEVIDARQDGRKGDLFYISWSAQSWKIAEPPSKATLDALDGATIDAWILDQKRTKESVISFDDDAGLMLRAFMSLLKAKNPSLVMPNRAEMEAKFKQLKEL